MTNKVISKNFTDILNQVPRDYYYQGIKSNILQKYWHKKKWRELKKHLDGLSNKKLLDIGCADGTTTYQIYKNFKNNIITGLDYYIKAIDFAKKKYPQIKFVAGDAHNMPFKNNSFDVITAIETLEHLHNPKKVLKEIYRVLKPRGYLIVVQDTNSLLFRSIWWFWTKWKGSVWKDSHINCVGPKRLLLTLKSIGFEVEDFTLYNLGMEMIITTRKK